MKTLIVYDSFFGNTKEIAQAIGDSLAHDHSVEITQVNNIKPGQLTGVELLIVGSPTRAFRPTKSITDFLNKVPPNGLDGVKVMAFDTRASVADINSRMLKTLVKAFGYAAEPITKLLRKKGGDLIIPPEGFFVEASEGPLKDGELKRAADWVRLAIDSLD
jgi:flavodoxin